MSVEQILTVIQAGAYAAAIILAYGYKQEREERVRITAKLIAALESNIKMNEAWQRVLPPPPAKE